MTEQDTPSRKIPRPLRRQVEVEAGHRCAIPTCRMTSGLEVHHIEDWAKVKEHTFDNLILLCAVCHHRATTGDIDRLAMMQYKANLAILNSRYGEMERRVLDVFVRDEASSLELDSEFEILIRYLIHDGVIEETPPPHGLVELRFGVPVKRTWRLTQAGRLLVHQLREAEGVS